ncbi:MFS transporter [Sphingomonas sp. S1-29]|uniref:MFS transporter n=1 Tax=Sphingomonas qomolangmaensis TaxID=2918765 RepID=A0ABY5L541_9SPHN|nr:MULTISPECIES: MFS transporter [Sphingomonas]UUL82063.1 MFS transporter [Sphingomonas qomolangmaensis]UZK68613.1 MFS transporter [Sphingomonas sp. S1-29]
MSSKASAAMPGVQGVNKSRLFWLGVLALFTAASSLGIRGAIASGLKAEWIDPIAPLQAGELLAAALGAAFLSFAITVFVASTLLDQIGMKRCLLGAGLCFVLGPLAIVFAGDLATGMNIYHFVWFGMLVSGIGWGLTEAAINPLTAQLYPEDTTHRLNVLHAWFPGGIIVGGLAGFFLADTLPWQGIMALVLIPAIATIVIAATTTFPPALREETGVGFGEMLGEVFRRPSFFIWFGAMFLTAASELAPGQWIDVALSNRVGMRGILLLVYVNALMFVFRHFAGRLANKISNPGLLWVSSLLAAVGLFMLSQAQSPIAAIIASTVWGLGVCVMWPTMLASVAERYPRGGSWAMGLVGSAGAMASFFVLPQLGAMFDEAKIEFAGGPAAFASLTGAAKLAVEDAAASLSFQRLAILPLILLAVFGVIWLRERGKSRAQLAGEAA